MARLSSMFLFVGVLLTACGSGANTAGRNSSESSNSAPAGGGVGASEAPRSAGNATSTAGDGRVASAGGATPGVASANATASATAGATAGATAIPAGARRTIDLSRVPVGDGKVSSSARVGYVWRCGGGAGGPGGGANVKGPWFNADGTYNSTAKAIVDGEVRWPSSFAASRSGSSRILSGNALPNHVTGRFPIQSNDDAYQYDRNPNTIAQQTLSVTLPADPQVAAQPSCVSPPFVAVLTSGAVVFDALDALNRDAGAWETQDRCAGHPERTGQYHYHTLSTCIADSGSGHSALLGWAVDGFGLFGVRGERGETLTNDDLDACHGHTHEIDWDGRRVTMYHYHATYEYPYTVSCYRGTPARLPLSAPR